VFESWTALATIVASTVSRSSVELTAWLTSPSARPSLIALAAALLINLGSMSALVEAVSHDPALVLVSGVLSFVAGLAVVRVHNHWAADWAVLVTIFGWLLLIGGLVRMLFPIWLAGMAATFSPSTGLIVGEAVVFLVIGAFLSYKAYISS
jgi:hypothetical protein